jgi:uncharacterized protein (TIGR02996 family)
MLSRFIGLREFEVHRFRTKDVMTSRQDALYRAICSHPDEDTPRLAFADLIEEEGDSPVDPVAGITAIRAAFIRTQVAIAKVPEYDPLHISTRQLHPDMLTGWGMAHTLPKIPGGYGWDKFEFRRGFPWKVGVLSLEAFVGDGACLFEKAPIQAIALDTRSHPKLSALADWPHLSRMHHLELSLGRLGAEALKRLGHSPHAMNLNELTFEYEGITAEGLEAFVQSPLFPKLKSLSLNSNIIPAALIVDALAAASERGSMSRMALISNGLSHADAAHLFALPLMLGLDYLDLSDNPQLGVAGARALAESGVLQGLRVLKLNSTRPGVPGLRELIQSTELSGMRSLHLSSNRLGPVAARLVAESTAVRGLRVLNLSHNPIQDRGAEALANSEQLSGLLELDLSDTEISEAGALALAESPYLNELLRLDLRSHTNKDPLSGKTRRLLVERFGRRVAC